MLALHFLHKTKQKVDCVFSPWEQHKGRNKEIKQALPGTNYVFQTRGWDYVLRLTVWDQGCGIKPSVLASFLLL